MDLKEKTSRKKKKRKAMVGSIRAFFIFGS